ncbi:MAG: 50S ribosomal protein L30 [Treponema sp.]|nr:50S ribosomal protein L30 [Treponema sp.]
MAGKLKITLTKSTIRQKADVKATVRSLGLKKLNSSVIHDDNPSIRGMIRRCFHILTVEEVQ